MFRHFRAVLQPPSNDLLVEQLHAQGSIYSEDVYDAFKETDRAHFLCEGSSPDGGADPYNDMPLRQGVLHLSAPSIYAAALEALELEEGLSFLNVGSGTGYFSAIAAHILGGRSVQFGVECRTELVEHSRQKLDALGHTHVQLVNCNVFNLDPESSMRFERIYVGAGASQRSASIIFRLLEVGGVAVGPFAGPHGVQRMLKVTRVSETSFESTEILGVQFTPLILPGGVGSPQPPGTEGGVSLVAPRWSPESHGRFDGDHRSAVYETLLCYNRPGTLLSLLPKDVLIDVVLPHIAFGSFAKMHLEGASGQPPPASTASASASAAPTLGLRPRTPNTEPPLADADRVAQVAAAAANVVGGGVTPRWLFDGEDGEEGESESRSEDGDEYGEEMDDDEDDEDEDDEEGEGGGAPDHDEGHEEIHQNQQGIVEEVAAVASPHHNVAAGFVSAYHQPPSHPSPLRISAPIASAPASSSSSIQAPPNPMADGPDGEGAHSDEEGAGEGDDEGAAPMSLGARIAAMRRSRVLRRILARLLRDGGSGGSGSSGPPPSALANVHGVTNHDPSPSPI